MTCFSHQGTASEMHLEDIVMNNVDNPIITYQKYCPHNQCNLKSPSRINLSNVSFRNIRGTTSTEVVVKLVCSQGVPCQDVKLGDINLKYSGNEGPAMSQCKNIKPNLLVNKLLVPKMLNLLPKSEQIVLLLLYSYLFMLTRLLFYW